MNSRYRIYSVFNKFTKTHAIPNSIIFTCWHSSLDWFHLSANDWSIVFRFGCDSSSWGWISNSIFSFETFWKFIKSIWFWNLPYAYI